MIFATKVSNTVVVTEMNQNTLSLNSVAQTGGDTAQVFFLRHFL